MASLTITGDMTRMTAPSILLVVALYSAAPTQPSKKGVHHQGKIKALTSHKIDKSLFSDSQVGTETSAAHDKRHVFTVKSPNNKGRNTVTIP